MSDWLGIKDRVAVVTGSSSGIGKAIALEFARAGCHVGIHANRSIEQGQQLVEQIESLCVKAHLFSADFSNLDFDAFVEQAWSWKNGIDFWINNAGADVLTGEAANLALDQKLAQLLKVDVEASWMLSRSVGKKMSEVKTDSSKPCIINIGWDQAWQGMAGDSGELFSITKGSIMAVSKSLAQSLAPNVRVNCIAPGWIKTAWGDSTSEYWDQRATSESLLNRWGTPEDIAALVVAICGRPGQFVNGQTIVANGGFNFQEHKPETL